MQSIWPHVWHYAGVLGILPWSLSWFQLVAMFEHHQLDAWDHTAKLTATIRASLGRKGVRIDSENPYRAARKMSARVALFKRMQRRGSANDRY